MASRRPDVPEVMFRRRLVALCVIIALLASALIYRMFDLQGGSRSALVNSGRKQRSATYPVLAQRGSILDRNGVELAVSIPRRNIAVDMTRLIAAGVEEWSDFDDLAAVMAPFVGRSSDELAQRMRSAGRDDLYVLLARNVPVSRSGELMARLKALDTETDPHGDRPGVASAVIVERSSQRINPAGDSGLRVIGKMGIDGPSKMAGIERSYDKQLSGTDGESRVELKRGSKGGVSGWAAIVTGEGRIDLSRKVGALPDSEQIIKQAVPGSSVQLTLDRAMQNDVERILIDGASRAGARRGVAIVGKPATGELLAVASVEADEETGEMGIADSPIALAYAYQAGSVFKLVTAAAGMEAGVVEPDTVMYVPDHIQVRNRTFRDHDSHPADAMTMTDIIAQSSNVGTIMIAQKLGKKGLYDALGKFGFGKVTGIAHPAEAAGMVPSFTKWTDPDLAAASIGTHESATALQLWAAYNVVANGGMYVQPRLVSSVLHPDGTRDTPAVAAPRRVISERTASGLSKVLQSVITEGTGKQWTLPGYSVAAKTGTSRMPAPKVVDRSDGYRWSDGVYHYLAAFTGFLPAGRPQVSITVILDDVGSGLSGSTAAGPIFSQLARLSIRELGIAPDENLGHVGSTAEEGRSTGRTAQVVVDGDGGLPTGTIRTPSGRVRAEPAVAPTDEDKQ